MIGPELSAVRSPWRTLGWPGLAGALALGAAAAVGSGLVPGWPPSSASAGQAPAPAEASAAPQRLASTSVADPLARLLALAAQEGVSVPRTEQRTRGAGEAGTRLHMPARGAYSDLRRFIEAALMADPRLALESLQLRRQTPEDPMLEADLVWWLAGGSR